MKMRKINATILLGLLFYQIGIAVSKNETTVLVTGANGFIGKALCRHLLSHGFIIRALTRDIHQKDLCQHEHMQWVIGDITDPQSLKGACHNIDYVFHLAGFAHAYEEKNDHFKKMHHQVNLEGTINIAREALSAGVKRFIFFSTIKACADSKNYCDETWQKQPLTAYGLAKRQSEEKLLAFCKEGEMISIVLRPSLVYGSGWKGNLQAMLGAIDKGVFPPPAPYENKKSMVSVMDLCEAARLAAIAPSPKHRIFIVTDGETYSTWQIYHLMRGALNKKRHRFYVPMCIWRIGAKLGDLFELVFKRRVSINSQTLNKIFGMGWYGSNCIQDELGYKPQYTFKDVLPEIVNNYRKRNK